MLSSWARSQIDYMPAVKDFHAISAERFFQTSQEYQMSGKECQAIPKTYLVFQRTNSPSLCIL